MTRSSLASLLMVALASAGYADDTGTVVRLSPAEIAAVQAKGLAAHAHDDALDTDIMRPKRTLHGEVGFGIGTGGQRLAYGTVVAPLGDEGVVALSVADGSTGRRTR